MLAVLTNFNNIWRNLPHRQVRNVYSPSFSGPLKLRKEQDDISLLTELVWKNGIPIAINIALLREL